MAALAQLRDLHLQFANITAEANRSVSSFVRGLEIAEEFAERAESSPTPNDPAVQELRAICRAYTVLCHRFIRELTVKESAIESQCGESRCGESRRKRRGVVFNVDRGDHVIAALEALRLEEFLDEQEKQGPKKVRFAD
ncbi:hypothetical protein EKO27_g5264 [Xylaria grammica]|uniref:Uncharacterized protein n=1 Tax=Xylaria grammica TaxID=363999 RepID=A0A439D614_9PEZI|nr:hypothetical protein EKO27_g5264 [Xylaria grammica]